MFDIPFLANLFGNQLIATLLLVALVLLLRYLAERLLRPAEEFISDDRRRVISNVKNAVVLLGVFGLLMIWAPSLRTLALSLTAFAVAGIIATKELILCLTGALLRTGANAFRVGDWIVVGDLRGQVIDQNLLTVTLQEIYADGSSYEFTGRTVTIPNSLFLSTTVKNEQFYKRYVYHSFRLTLPLDADLSAVERAVREAVGRGMAPHLEVARRYNALIERRAGIDLAGVEPQVRFGTTNDGRVQMVVTAFLPTREALCIEQEAVRAVLGLLREQQKLEKAETRKRSEEYAA